MTTLTINLDDKLKKRAQKRAKKQGLTLTSLISGFLNEYLQGYWEMRLTPQGRELLEASREADEELANGTGKLYSNVDEMMEDILNEPNEV